jgi:hypothetical protein
MCHSKCGEATAWTRTVYCMNKGCEQLAFPLVSTKVRQSGCWGFYPATARFANHVLPMEDATGAAVTRHGTCCLRNTCEFLSTRCNRGGEKGRGASRMRRTHHARGRRCYRVDAGSCRSPGTSGRWIERNRICLHPRRSTQANAGQDGVVRKARIQRAPHFADRRVRLWVVALFRSVLYAGSVSRRHAGGAATATQPRRRPA